MGPPASKFVSAVAPWSSDFRVDLFRNVYLAYFAMSGRQHHGTQSKEASSILKFYDLIAN